MYCSTSRSATTKITKRALRFRTGIRFVPHRLDLVHNRLGDHLLYHGHEDGEIDDLNGCAVGARRNQKEDENPADHFPCPRSKKHSYSVFHGLPSRICNSLQNGYFFRKKSWNQ